MTPAPVRPEPFEGQTTRRVLDTNIVLDLWVFDDPDSAPLRESLDSGHTQWLATASMREELARVLHYPHIARRLDARAMTAEAVLACFDRHAQRQPDAPKAPYVCKDADDQKFIDLAVQYGAALHSKDAQVLCMKNRLARCGVALNPVVDCHAPAALAMTNPLALTARSAATRQSTSPTKECSYDHP